MAGKVRLLLWCMIYEYNNNHIVFCMKVVIVMAIVMALDMVYKILIYYLKAVKVYKYKMTILFIYYNKSKIMCIIQVQS